MPGSSPDKLIDSVVFFEQNQPQFNETLTAGEKCIKGQPLQRSWHHYSSPDEAFLAGFWEAEPGCWSVDYTEHEFCQIISGRSILRDANGGERELRPGDNFVIPAGFEGQWEVVETTRKIYVIYQP